MSRYGPVGIGGFNPQRSDSFGHPPSDRSGGGGRDNRYSDRDFARDGGHRGGELGRGGRGRGGGRGAGRGGGGAWPDRQGLESKDPMKWMYGEKGERTDLVVDDMRNSFFRQQDDDDDAEKNALTNRSSVLSRRILNNCQTDREANSQFFLHDGTNIAYSCVPLVLEKEISEPDLKKPRLSILQENGDLAFKVQANLNCDDDDPSKDKSKTRWFQVRFRLVASVPFDVLCRAMVVACVNTALKNSMIVKMIPFGRSPDAFFFKLDQQAQLRPKTMTDRYLNDSEEPIIGLRQSVRPALSENCLWLIAKPAMRRVYKEEKKNPPGPYKILEVKHRDTAVLAGVQIANLQQCVPVENREEIEKALMGRTFHVKYLRGSKWVEKVQKKGKPLEWIEKHKHFEKRNQKVWKVPNDSKETCIVWAADDPDLYRFEDQNGTRQTVYSYYQEQHGLRLQYPKMPIVRISKIEYFPVEYLNQALGEVRGDNSDKQIKDALEFHDFYASGKLVDHITSILHSKPELAPFQDNQRKTLEKLNLRVNKVPLTLQAKVLKEPVLRFMEKSALSSVGIKNGSWGLHSAEFETPSEMLSFAVIDYTGSSLTSKASSEVFEPLFDACRKHGMSLPPFDNTMFERLKVKVDKSMENLKGMGLATMKDHFSEAIKRAHEYFLDSKASPFETLVRNNHGAAIKCAVKLNMADKGIASIRPPNSAKEYNVPVSSVCCPSIIFVYLPGSDRRLYSCIKFLSNCHLGVQSQVIVKGSRNSQYFSNLALKLNTKLSTCIRPSRAWRRVLGAEVGLTTFWVDEVPTLIIGISLASAQGQDSKMVVVATACLDNSGLMMCQAARLQKKGPIIAENAMIEIVRDLAMQYSQCNGFIKPQRVVIYRSGGDDGLFEEIIAKEVRAVKTAFHMLNLTDTNYRCNCCRKENGCVWCLPKVSMVVAQNQHNMIIVPGERSQQSKNVPSGTCLDEPCGLFAPLSLDDKKMHRMQSELELNKEQAGKDCNFEIFECQEPTHAFLLVPHGGLKGTSKSVLYRCIWNENLVFKPGPINNTSPLTSQNLQYLTFSLSFQYGTATKAPRLPAILQYSMRMSNVAMGYIELLFASFTGDEGQFISIPAEEDDIYRRADGDGRIFPAFDPFYEGKGFHIPFHPHLSA